VFKSLTAALVLTAAVLVASPAVASTSHAGVTVRTTRQCWTAESWALGVYVHNGTDDWVAVGGVPIGPHTFVALRQRPVFEASVAVDGRTVDAPGRCYTSGIARAVLTPVAVRSDRRT
jgi:hypothetical protein